MGSTTKKYECRICHRSNCKLYRPYMTILEKAGIYCGRHLEVVGKRREWYVPLIQADDGTVWGYGASIPEADRKRFDDLPA